MPSTSSLAYLQWPSSPSCQHKCPTRPSRPLAWITMLFILLQQLILSSYAQLDTTKLIGGIPKHTSIRKDMLPVALFSKFSGPAPTQVNTLKFHWVITSCSARPRWGRFLSSTLLSGIFNDLRPSSISIAYCRDYNERQLPALLYNLRHSHSINIFFPSPDWPNKHGNYTTKAKKARMIDFWKVTVTALHVPTLLGEPDWPLLITEDDVLFAPDVHARLAMAVKDVQALVKGDPYYLMLYRHNKPKRLQPGANSLPQDASRDDRPADAHIELKPTIQRDLAWGGQGVLYSPGMVNIFIHVFDQLIHGTYSNQTHLGFSDWVIFNHLVYDLKCNDPDSKCHSFSLNPSVVQHIGTTSLTYQKGKINKSFHLGVSYPVHVAFPGFEDDELW